MGADLGGNSPQGVRRPDATLVLATEVAAIDHTTGSVYLMAIAWNLNGSDEGVDGAYDRAIERLDAMTAQLASPIAPAVLGGEWPGGTCRPSAHAARGLRILRSRRQAGDHGW